MGIYVIKRHSTTYSLLVQGLNPEVRPLDPSLQLMGGQRREEHLDLHHECAIPNSSLGNTPHIRGPKFLYKNLFEWAKPIVFKAVFFGLTIKMQQILYYKIHKSDYFWWE